MTRWSNDGTWVWKRYRLKLCLHFLGFLCYYLILLVVLGWLHQKRLGHILTMRYAMYALLYPRAMWLLCDNLRMWWKFIQEFVFSAADVTNKIEHRPSFNFQKKLRWSLRKTYLYVLRTLQNYLYNILCTLSWFMCVFFYHILHNSVVSEAFLCENMFYALIPPRSHSFVFLQECGTAPGWNVYHAQCSCQRTLTKQTAVNVYKMN